MKEAVGRKPSGFAARDGLRRTAKNGNLFPRGQLDLGRIASHTMTSHMHVIRLHGPWELEPLAHTRFLPDGSTTVEPGELPPARRTQVPADWAESLGRDFRGRVRYTRRFGRPSSLETVDRVELVVTRVDAFGAVELNGQPLVKIPWGKLDARVDITSQLQPRNVLCVEVELPHADADCPPLLRPGRADSAGGLIGEVRLEIFPSVNDGRSPTDNVVKG